MPPPFPTWPNDATKFLRGDKTWAVPPSAEGGVPAGIIAMFGGLLSAIPAGWVLCDGNNGTPDLRSRFIKGAAVGANAGATGGAATHTHTYTDVVTHTHTVNVTDPGHTHPYRSQTATTGGATSYEHGAPDTSSTEAAEGETTDSATTGITAATAAPAGAVATGTTAAGSSEPAFYALAFIQKT